VVTQKGVDVKLVPSPDGQATFLLARSVDRRSKELAMHEKFIGHMEAGLKRLKSAAESGRLRDERLAGEWLGRLKERFWRTSQAFDVTIRKLPQPIGKQHLEVSWELLSRVVFRGLGSGGVLQDSVGENFSFENKNDLLMPVESSPTSAG